MYAPDSADKPVDYDLSKAKIEYINEEELKHRLSKSKIDEEKSINEDEINTEVGPTISSITYDSAGPVQSKLYYGLFLPEFQKIDGHQYIKFVPKQLIYPADEVSVIVPDETIKKIKFQSFRNEAGELIPKATVNHKWVWAQVDKQLSGWEVAF